MATSDLDHQQAVLTLLQQLKGVEPLKQLFWSELNYDHVNQPLSRRGWKDNVAGLLAADPVLLASGADAFHIIYARLASAKLLMGDERPVVSRLLAEHPYALFVFSNSTGEHFHFLNVKYDTDVEKRRLFRRITVGPNERLRTASERIALLDLAGVSPHPLAIQQRHDEAFDVEPVTREFFSEYRRIFEEVEESITGFRRDKDTQRLFTQRLFNRLMFLAFIEKKGWLRLNGDADYLAALWKAHQKDASFADKNFYRDRLKALFFYGLNSPNEVNQAGINRGGFLKSVYGEVPYLNGGLFEEDEDDRNDEIKVPDKAVGAVLTELFSRFNFTVTESTPLDVEVAVDPEMLGKIFEELVTGRHESGSYYTPKPVVSFMCREALKGYLQTGAPGESAAAIERFVEKHEPDDLRNAEAVLDALRRVKVCDPACGSGAYLLGMLHELLDLRAALFHSNKKLDAKNVYDRKLEIIQTNLYGVDKDEFAVNIARLRLWLSLAVDFEGEKPEPLPNLDYKVEAGDSLLGPNPSGGIEMGFRKPLIDQFLKLKAEFLTSHHGHKRNLKKQIDNLRADIASFNGHADAQGFDWAVEFAEVFAEGGFDIAIANPPYVRMELFKEIKPLLKMHFNNVHSDRTDLYCYFFARAEEMLAKCGALAFISSGKWLRSGYGSKLRSYLGTRMQISHIIDFGDLPVFQAASAYPCIFMAQKRAPEKTAQCAFVEVKSLDDPYPDIQAILKESATHLPAASLSSDNWQLQSSVNIEVEAKGMTLREYVSGKIFYGVKTGLNEAFVIDDKTRNTLVREDRKCSDFIKPLISGRDITRWKASESGKWLIYLPHGVDVKNAGPILRHLKAFKRQLEERATKQEWYELQQPQYRYSQQFDQPKLVYQVFQVKPCFAIDQNGSYVNNSVYVIPQNDLFLLAIMNSGPFWSEVSRCCSKIQNGYQLMLTYFERVMIPNADNRDKQALAKLAAKCVASSPQPSPDLEAEIDKRVEELYGKQ